jgi:4-diphosphocytidyl-2-C-methyl-D-erythritol kinase
VSAVLVERAPAKVNLVLQVGPRRRDGLHEICSLFAPLDLADEVRVEPGGSDDAVECPGVSGPNLAANALAEFRSSAGERAGDLSPLRVTIDKRVPVAAGLGGGSADAAAALRAANELSGRPLGHDELRAVAARVGADVPSQVEPAAALVTGAGERVEPLELPPMALVLVPDAEGLSTAAVYEEADRLGTTRAELDPQALRRLASAPLEELVAGLANDLAGAAISLRPELSERLEAVRAAGALGAGITGSGPTVFGVFADLGAARAAADGLPGALATKVESP